MNVSRGKCSSRFPVKQKKTTRLVGTVSHRRNPRRGPLGGAAGCALARTTRGFSFPFFTRLFGARSSRLPVKQKKTTRLGGLFLFGGDGKTRTYDLMHVKHAL